MAMNSDSPGQPVRCPSLLSSTGTEQKCKLPWTGALGLMVSVAHLYGSSTGHIGRRTSAIKCRSLSSLKPALNGGTILEATKLPLDPPGSLPSTRRPKPRQDLPHIALRRHLGVNYRTSDGCFRNRSCRRMEKKRECAYVLGGRGAGWMMPTLRRTHCGWQAWSWIRRTRCRSVAAVSVDEAGTRL